MFAVHGVGSWERTNLTQQQLLPLTYLIDAVYLLRWMSFEVQIYFASLTCKKCLICMKLFPILRGSLKFSKNSKRTTDPQNREHLAGDLRTFFHTWQNPWLQLSVICSHCFHFIPHAEFWLIICHSSKLLEMFDLWMKEALKVTPLHTCNGPWNLISNGILFTD